MQTVCTSLQTDNHTNTSSLGFFCRSDALPDTQPANSVKALQAKTVRKQTCIENLVNFVHVISLRYGSEQTDTDRQTDRQTRCWHYYAPCWGRSNTAELYVDSKPLGNVPTHARTERRTTRTHNASDPVHKMGGCCVYSLGVDSLPLSLIHI